MYIYIYVEAELRARTIRTENADEINGRMMSPARGRHTGRYQRALIRYTQRRARGALILNRYFSFPRPPAYRPTSGRPGRSFVPRSSGIQVRYLTSSRAAPAYEAL